MKLLLVRHGEIVSNINKVYAGRSPESLTRKGTEQAREVAERIKNYDVDTLYTSPIQRAVQTTEIIAEVTGINYIIENSFRELELGPWEGLSEEEIAASYLNEWLVWQNRPAELKLHGRETLEELLERVLNGVRNIYKAGSDRTIVAVTHVAIIRVLLLWHANQSLNLYKTLHVPNASVFEIKIDVSP